MKTTITFELETDIREQLAAICSRYNLSLEEAFTSLQRSSSKQEGFHTTWKCLTR